MEILIWLVIATITSWAIITFWYKRKVKDKERSLEKFILADENLRKVILKETNYENNSHS